MSDAPVDVVVVGLGNPILCDDGVGWRVAHAVRQWVQARELDLDLRRVHVDVVEACVGGLSLAELLVGYDQAIVVDAILTSQGEPGRVYRLALDVLPGTLNTASAHDTNLVTALRALRRFGAALPRDSAIAVVAVEAADVWTFSEACTAAVESSISEAAAAVIQIIEGIAKFEEIRP